MSEHDKKTGYESVNCPHCDKPLPFDWFASKYGKMLIERKRATVGLHSGPEKVYYACGCGKIFSAREFRAHVGCEFKPPRDQWKKYRINRPLPAGAAGIETPPKKKRR